MVTFTFRDFGFMPNENTLLLIKSFASNLKYLKLGISERSRGTDTLDGPCPISLRVEILRHLKRG
jgi:hypothetical protein